MSTLSAQQAAQIEQLQAELKRSEAARRRVTRAFLKVQRENRKLKKQHGDRDPVLQVPPSPQVVELEPRRRKSKRKGPLGP